MEEILQLPPDDEALKRMGEDRTRSVEVVLVPDADHCIETRARDEYRRCVETCLRWDRPEPGLEIRMETLRRFLEQADFRRLRRESDPLLTAGGTVRFRIGLDGERARWRIETHTSGDAGQ